MAKARPQSKHSRAARRATSPSIDTDKSLKEASLPRASSDLRPSVLAAHRSAAVQKKKTARKAQMSARARRRHEKGLEMAESVCERTAAKVQRSVHRQRVVNARRKAWDDINKLAADADAAVATNPFDALAAADRGDESEADVEPARADTPAVEDAQPPAIDHDEIL